MEPSPDDEDKFWFAVLGTSLERTTSVYRSPPGVAGVIVVTCVAWQRIRLWQMATVETDGSGTVWAHSVSLALIERFNKGFDTMAWALADE